MMMHFHYERISLPNPTLAGEKKKEKDCRSRMFSCCPCLLTALPCPASFLSCCAVVRCKEQEILCTILVPKHEREQNDCQSSAPVPAVPSYCSFHLSNLSFVALVVGLSSTAAATSSAICVLVKLLRLVLRLRVGFLLIRWNIPVRLLSRHDKLVVVFERFGLPGLLLLLGVCREG